MLLLQQNKKTTTQAAGNILCLSLVNVLRTLQPKPLTFAPSICRTCSKYASIYHKAFDIKRVTSLQRLYQKYEARQASEMLPMGAPFEKGFARVEFSEIRHFRKFSEFCVK